MTLKSIIESPCGIRHMLETLDLQSGFARNVLLDTEMLHDEDSIEQSYSILHRFYEIFVQNPSNGAHLQTLQFRLRGLRNILGTLDRIQHGATLDDVELFEVKNLAMLSHDVRQTLQQLTPDRTLAHGISYLEPVVEILNPDPIRLASFYIFDSYSPELQQIRAELKTQPENKETLFLKAAAIEDKIRNQLRVKLIPHLSKLRTSLIALANIDINIAKVLQMKNLGLTFPNISKTGTTSYTGLFNPEVKAALQVRKRQFQPVDIAFGKTPILITGANMGGKTVLLKTLALSQYLFQFGFGIPAQSAQIEVKDEIHFCIGDEQSANEGLSSFAAEMKRIDRLIAAVRTSKNVLALVDEPARTTNPVEGSALVRALLKILAHKNLDLLVTTHYDVKSNCCKYLRVNGLVNGTMDYTLVEAAMGDVPHEALNIAQSLGIDTEWISEARNFLNA